MLKSYLDRVNGLEFAAIFGSAVREMAFRDVDIAAKAREDIKYQVLCQVLRLAAEALGIPEEKIDVVDLDRADIDLKREIVAHGLTLVDKVGFRSKLISELDAVYPEYGEMLKLSLREWLESDPLSVNAAIVKRRVDFMKAELRFLEQNVLQHSIDEVKESPTLSRLLERSFQLSIEAALNVLRHIVSAMGWGPATSYVELVEIASRNGVVDRVTRDWLVGSIRLRNIIIHRYLDVDYDELYRRSSQLRTFLKRFEAQVADFVKKTSRSV